MRKLFAIPLIIYVTVSCTGFEDNNERVEIINGVIDSILKATQKSIHSITNIIIQKIRYYNKGFLLFEPENEKMSEKYSKLYKSITNLLDCKKVKEIKQMNKAQLKKRIEKTRLNLLVLEGRIIIIKNTIDRLVMNGGANFTGKCDIYTDSQLKICLEQCVDEAKDTSDNTIERLGDTLHNLRVSTC